MIPWNHGRSSPILVTPFELASVGHVSYAIVDTASRTAVVIDPQPDVDPYLELAARFGARIRHVFLTKFHSDFEGGHLALAGQAGAVVYVGARGRASYPHLPVKEGDALQFGATELRILETPGHTTEGISLVASDISGPPAPWGLFAGDLVFDGDLARPEPRLDDGLSAAELGEQLYRSIHENILRLDPDTLLFSGHRAGPLPNSSPPALGALRRRHPLLRPMAEKAFVAAVTAGMLPAPMTRGTRHQLNRADRRGAASARLRHLSALSPAAFLALVEQGAVAVDLREPMEFAASHLRGSLSLGLGAAFESWAPAVLDPTEEYVLVVNPGSEEEAALRLRPLLGTRIRGILEHGLSSLENRPGLLEQSPQEIIPSGGRGGRRGGLAARVDVRAGDPFERDPAGSGRRLPLEELLGRLGEVPEAGGHLTVIDEDPYRAQAAASLLRRRGWPGALPMITCGAPARFAIPRSGAP